MSILVTLIIVAIALLAVLAVPLITTGMLMRFFKRDGVLVLAGLVALTVGVLVNFVADKKFARLDLTAESKYSVTAEMRHIIDRLGTDTAKITYFVYAKTPMFEPFKRNMLDKLNELKNAADGKIAIEVIDPSTDAKLMEDLKQANFVRQINISQSDEFSMQTLVSGLRVTYKDKPSVDIPQIHEADVLEYELGSVLIELTTDKKPIIALNLPPAPQQSNNPMMRNKPQGNGFEWLTGDAHYGIDTKKFDAKTIDLTEAQPLPMDASLFMTVRPKEWNERQRYEVEKYLAQGGKVFLVESPVKMKFEMQWSAEKSPTGFDDYLKEIGVNIGSDFIADKAHLQIEQTDIFGRVSRFDNKLFVKILAPNLDQNSGLTRLMPGLVMPNPVEIKLDQEALSKKKLTATVLARTTKESLTVPFSANIDPEKVDLSGPFPDGSKAVFVMVQGQFPFPFADKPVPEWPKESTDPEKDKDKPKDKKDDKKPETIVYKPGTLVICSAPEAFYAPYLMEPTIGRNMQGNIALVQNLAESMSLGDDLMRLRAKRYETRALAGLTGADKADTRTYWIVFLIFGIPILVLVAAEYRFIVRHSRQLAYERKFANTTGPSSFTQ